VERFQDIATAMAPTLTDTAMYLAAGTGVRAYDPATFALLAPLTTSEGTTGRST